MTKDEKDAEKIKALAAAVYCELCIASRAERYVRQIAGKHYNHPAFKKYMADMALEVPLDEFLARTATKGMI